MNEERIWRHLEKLNDEVGEMCERLAGLEGRVGELKDNQKTILRLLVAIAIGLIGAAIKALL